MKCMFVMACALLHLPSVLAGTCSDGEENAFRTSSLIQQRVGVARDSAGLDVEEGYLQNALVMVRGLASNVTVWDTNLSQTEKDALGLIKLFVEKMFKSANSTHAEDQREVDRVEGLIIGCGNRTENELLDKVDPKKNTMMGNRIAHDGCRASEAKYTVNKSELCEAWDAFRKNISNTPDSCRGIKFNASTLSTEDQTLRSNMEQCLRDLQPFYLRHKLCRDVSQLLDQTAPVCDKKQVAFEHSYCDYQEKLTYTCAAQTTCRVTHIGVRTNTHSDVEKNELARKADYATGKKVLCYFGVFEANNTDKTTILHECDSLTVNTSHLDIVYPLIPVKHNCTPETYEPCDAEWNHTEYSNKSWRQDVTMLECEPCVSKRCDSGALPSQGGGAAGATSYTSPHGWVVRSNLPTYNNENLYWLSNLVDGSSPCDVTTCSTRDTRYGGGSNCYWLAAGSDGNSYQPDSFIEVEMDRVRYLDYVDLEPATRSNGFLTNFRVLADGKDVTPVNFSQILSTYNTGTSWSGYSVASGAACESMIRVPIHAIVRTIRLVNLTQGDIYAGFGEIKPVCGVPPTGSL